MIKLGETKTVKTYEITGVSYIKAKFKYEIIEDEKEFEVMITSDKYGIKKYCWGAKKNQGTLSDEEIIKNYMERNYLEDIYDYVEDVKIIETYKELIFDIDEIRDDMTVL